MSPSGLDDELRRALEPSYVLERQLGRGGMGVVYLARELSLERPVAIKVLPSEFAADAESRAGFLHETRTAASFSHPNIVPVHAVEERGGMLCFVMGFVDGETLTERVRHGGPLGAAETVRLVQEVAWALSYAHARGVIHRDVKPDNILLERATGRALVTDFGIARTAARQDALPAGQVLGTPHYMSPEQAVGDELDGRSDLYSLGVVAYFAVTGRAPFEGASASALLAQHLTSEPPRVEESRADLPDGLVSAIHTLLRKDPAERFGTGEAVVEALDALRAARPDVAPSIRLFLSRAPALALGAAAIALAEPAIARNVPFDADRAVVRAILITVFVGLVARLVTGVRALKEQGFGYAAFRRAVAALNVERRAVREQRTLAPRWRERRRRRTILLALAFVISTTMLIVARANRTYVGDGRYRVGPALLMAALVASVGLIIVVWTVAADLLVAITTTPLSHRVWTGPIGRAFYRIATLGMAEPPSTGASVSPARR